MTLLRTTLLCAASTLLFLLPSCTKPSSDIPDNPWFDVDDPGQEEEEPVAAIPDSVGTGLPVIYLRTDKGAEIASKEVYTDGTVEICGASKYADFQKATCRLRGRGNTTWSWPKKPYLMVLDSKASLLGMPEHKRWVLLANFMDRTLMRNIIAMKVGSLTSLDWTPKCVPVELMLNGVHKGTYLLIEQVRTGSPRIPVPKETGVLLELDYHQDNEYQWISPYGTSADKDCRIINGITFGIKNPDPVSTADMTSIKTYVDSVAAQVYAGSSSIGDCIDLQSFADYFIVFEVMGNGELGNPGSVYFHYDPAIGSNGRPGKIIAGPIWDFDWGTLSSIQGASLTRGFLNRSAIWYKPLLQNAAFTTVLKNRWNTLKPSFEEVPAYIDSTQTLLKASSVLNFKMWNPAEDSNFNGGNIINQDENMTYDEAVKRLRSIYVSRLSTLDQLFNAL